MIKLPDFPRPGDVLRNLAELQPSSSIPPVSNSESLPHYDNAVKVLDQLWENTKSIHNDAYKVGKSYFVIDADIHYADLLKAFVNLFFSSIKEQVVKATPNLVDQQDKILHIKAIHKAIEANIEILKAHNFGVDKTQLLALINGYSMALTAGILKK